MDRISVLMKIETELEKGHLEHNDLLSMWLIKECTAMQGVSFFQGVSVSGGMQTPKCSIFLSHVDGHTCLKGTFSNSWLPQNWRAFENTFIWEMNMWLLSFSTCKLLRLHYIILYYTKRFERQSASRNHVVKRETESNLSSSCEKNKFFSLFFERMSWQSQVYLRNRSTQWVRFIRELSVFLFGLFCF